MVLKHTNRVLRIKSPRGDRQVIIKAYILLFLYLFGPVTRVMMDSWLCRKLDTDVMYLKSDMQYECYQAEHNSSVVLSVLLWIPFALVIPLAAGYVIRRDRHRALFQADGITPRNTFDDESQWMNLVQEAFHTHVSTQSAHSSFSDTGELSKSEFRKACQYLAEKAGLKLFDQTDEDFEKTFEDVNNEVDKDGDKMVDFGEFIAAVRRLDLNFETYWTSAFPSRTERWWYVLVMHIEPTHW